MGRMCPASPKGAVMRRLFLIPTLVVAVMMAIIATGSVSSAQGDGLTVPASTVIRGNAGDVIELGRIPVDTARAGPLCTWQATVMNQTSVHPNTDILLESNGTTLVLADVEAVPNKVTSNSGSAFLADEVVVSVRLGPLGLFGGRMEVTIDYSKCMFCALCVDPCPVDCIFMGATHDLSCYSRDGCLVDFSRLPLDVAWGRATLNPTAVADSKVIAEPVHGGPNQ